jgi:branched-chain amino acid transport system substrate-binding protein
MRRSVFVVIGMIAAVLLVACSSGSGGSQGLGSTSQGSGSTLSGAPVQVAWINPGVGTGNVFPEATAAAQAAVSYINSDLGGVDGHPIKLDVCQSDGSAESDGQCAQRLAQDNPRVLTLAQDFNTPSIYPPMTAKGIPIIGGTPAVPADLTAKNTYWLSTDAGVYLAGVGNWIGEHLHPKSVTLLYDNPAASSGLGLIKSSLEKHGATVVGDLVNPASADWLAVYQSAARSDVVMTLFGSQQSCTGFAQARQSQHGSIPVFSTDPCAATAVLNAVPGGLDGWYVGSESFEEPTSTPTAEMKIFQKELKQYAGKSALDGFSVTAFGTIMTTYSVLKDIGYKNLSTTSIANYMRTKSGQVFLGGPFDCAAAQSSAPAICSNGLSMYRFSGDQLAPLGPLFNEDGTALS